MRFASFGIVGGGAWGTALAHAMRVAGRETLLWAREEEVVAEINTHHRNTPFLPGVALHPGLAATEDLARIAAQDAVLMVAPAQHVRATAAALAPHLPAGKPVVICAKGLEQATGKLLGQVLAETIPPAVVGIMFLNDHTRPGMGGVAVVGFSLAVVCAVALARFGETYEQGLTAAQRRVMAERSPNTAS